MKIAYSGHRYVHDYDLDTINARVMQDMKEPDLEEMYFGGAIGSDTYALRFAFLARGAQRKLPMLTVVCPDTKEKLPYLARRGAEKHADRIIELHNEITGRDGWHAFDVRNQYMVDQIRDVGQLVAFWTGRRPSGTWNAIEYAMSTGALWEHVQILGAEPPP